MNNEFENTRINGVRLYLFNILNQLRTDSIHQINANMLSEDVNNYSLDRIPTMSGVEKWISGDEISREVYSFRSRLFYSSEAFNNLNNIGFFERFEKLIKDNNREGVLPNIEGIQSIECLNCGSIINTNTNTATFDIQIQITYKERKGEVVSL